MGHPARRPTPAEQRRTPLVLVVDDHADTRDLYAASLTVAGIRAETAADGAEAIAHARAMRPDLIIMDVEMPKLDGREAIRVLKADPATSSIIMIALTGRALTNHGEALYEVGCDQYLTKPVSPDALAAAVSSALASRGIFSTGSWRRR